MEGVTFLVRFGIKAGVLEKLYWFLLVNFIEADFFNDQQALCSAAM